MTDRRSWFKFYPDDFIAGTTELSAHDAGVYIKLLARMYARDGFVKNDPEALSRLCGTRPMRFKKALETLIESGKIIEDGSTLTNKRVQKEVQVVATIVTSASENAKKRWDKEKKGKTNKNKARPKNPHKDRTLFADTDGMHARRNPEPDKKYPSDIKKDAGAKAGEYAFDGRVIRLDRDDFDRWKKSFAHIPDLTGELQRHDDYLAGLEPGKLGNWFARTSAFLANRNTELAAKAAEANAEENARSEKQRRFEKRRKAYFDADAICDRIYAEIEALDKAHGKPAHGPERDALCIKLRAAKDERDKFA